MRRAYIGFSTPIGYDYTTETGEGESWNWPNPIISGLTGLLVFHDELWFPTRRQCPHSLTELEYVKFIDELYPDFSAPVSEWISAADEQLKNTPSIFDRGWSDLIKLYIQDGRCDNHSRGLDIFGGSTTGNPTPENFIFDLSVLHTFRDFDLVPVMSPLTRDHVFPDPISYLRQSTEAAAASVHVTESLFTIRNVPDLVDARYGYHPIIEELRNHDYVSNFRKWMDHEFQNWDNATTDDVVNELDSVATDFVQSRMRQAVGENFIRSSVVDIVREELLSFIPGSALAYQGIEAIKNRRELEGARLGAFISSAQHSVFKAYQSR